MVINDLRIVVKDVVDGVATVAVSGELDAATCGCLHLALSAFGDVPEIEHVILDLRELTFMDSSGLSTIVADHRLLAERTGASLSVTGAHGSVRKVLEITGILGYLSGTSSHESGVVASTSARRSWASLSTST